MKINKLLIKINSQVHDLCGICGKNGRNHLPPRRHILKVETHRLNVLFNSYAVSYMQKVVYMNLMTVAYSGTVK